MLYDFKYIYIYIYILGHRDSKEIRVVRGEEDRIGRAQRITRVIKLLCRTL